MNKRLSWVDILKGIGMLAVVLGHSGFPIKVQVWIWSYHMPLFFFISGFLFSPLKYNRFSEFVSRKVSSLLVPYLYFSVIVILLSAIRETGSLYTMSMDVAKNGWETTALWFIPVLFLTEVFFYLLNMTKNRYIIGVCIFLCSLVGLWFYKINFHLPYKVEVIFIAIFFYGIGYLSANKIKQILPQLSRGLEGAFFVTLLALNIVLCFANTVKLDLAFNIIGNYFYAILSALSGIFAFTILASLIQQISDRLMVLLTYVGRNTLIILGLHQILKVYLVDLFNKISSKSIVLTGLRHLAFWLIIVFLIEVINNYLPFLVGRKREFKQSMASTSVQ